MSAEKKLSLFVFIDAFGWEILQQHSFLDDVLTTKAPLQTIFGYSSTCDPTIITGQLPRDHGHFSFFYYNPEESPFRPCRYLSVLPRSLTSRGRVRRLLSRALQRYYGYTGYFQIYNMPFDVLPLFDYSEKRDLYQPGGINSGSRTIFDLLRENEIPFSLSDWRRPEEENLDSLSRAIAQGDARFAYLYLASMDAILHADGTSSPRVDRKIQWYDGQLRRIYEQALRQYGSVNLFVFSDHGMTDIQEDCPLIDSIGRLGLQFGTDYAAVYDSTMARFWFLKEGAREKITGVLQQESRGEILSDARLHEFGCDFPERKYGELFFLMNPGVLLCPSFLGEKHLDGMHGFDPGHKDSVASFSTNIRPDPMPNRLDDLYNLMLSEVR